MRANALKKADTSEPPPRRGLKAVPAKKPKQPTIKVYTGSDELKERIKAAAHNDRPGQSVSSFLIGLFWKYQNGQSVESATASRMADRTA